jgi:hypothetical protein
VNLSHTQEKDMQMLAAATLKKVWGDKPCEHPVLDKEYHLGAATGDYACTTCGESRAGSDWNQSRNSHAK